MNSANNVMHFKAPDNSLHFIESEEYIFLLPSGSVRITDEEAKAIIQASKPVPTAKDLLAKLDSENALTQRNLRETILLMAEAFKVVSNNAVDLSQIPGVAKVAEVEAQAAALRAQL